MPFAVTSSAVSVHQALAIGVSRSARASWTAAAAASGPCAARSRQRCGVVADGATRLRQHAHREQHSSHVGMTDDRDPALLARRAALHAVARVGDGRLVGTLREPDALQAHAQAHVIHHREHRGQALVRLADEKALGPATVAEGHDAGRARVDTHLVFDGDAVVVVALAETAIGVHLVLRHHEERDALRPRRCVRQASEHQVHDVLRHGVVAPGDEDLLASDEVAVALRLRTSREVRQVGARLRLRQAHRP